MEKNLVFLRPLELSDIPRTSSWLNTDFLGEVMGYMPHSLEHQVEWFKQATRDESRYIFAICDANTNHIGNISLGNISYIDRNGSLALFIADVGNRRKGYGASATKLILNFAFERLNLIKVNVRTSSVYPGALEFWQELGFEQEGVLRKQKFQFGEYQDKYLLAKFRNLSAQGNV
jgi:RimJ/RimL family protein N-acetyltransferase